MDDFFLLQRCLGKSQAVRPSVSKAKETTGTYNGPYPKGELSNKLDKIETNKGRTDEKWMDASMPRDQTHGREHQNFEGPCEVVQ